MPNLSDVTLHVFLRVLLSFGLRVGGSSFPPLPPPLPVLWPPPPLPAPPFSAPLPLSSFPCAS